MAALPESLTAHDGLRLHVCGWLAAGGAAGGAGGGAGGGAAGAVGTALLVHGLGEHIGRYGHVAAHLNRWGWQVAGWDQRGHGRSEGARGGLPAPDDLLRDLATVIDAVRAALPGPLLLLGHSMGGLVAARFVAGSVDGGEPWSRPVDALVLSSPALAVEMSAAQRLLLAVAGRLAPNLGLGNGLDPAWISRDPQVVQRYAADPLVHDRITPRLARFFVEAGRFIERRAARWRVPSLLLWAGADRCVAPAGSAGFAAAAPQAVVAAHEFRTLAHEIFNEPEQEQVFEVLGQWLRNLELPAGQ